MSQSSLIRQGVLSTVGVAVQGLARFGYSIAIARFVGAEPLAVVNTLIAISLLLSLLWPTAAGNAAGMYLVRVERAGGSPGRLLRALWGSSGVVVAVAGVVGGVAAVFVVGGGAATGVALLAVTAAWSAYILARGVRMGLGQVGAAALWDSVSAVVSLGLLAVFIAAGVTDATLLYPLAIGYALFAIAAVPAMVRRTRAAVGEAPRVARDLWSLLAWNSVGLIATNGLIQVAMVFAYATSDAYWAGMFAAAIALATPASMLAQAVSQVLIPRYAGWLIEGERVARDRHVRVMLAMAGVLLVAFGLVAALSGWLVPLLYGPGYEGAVGLLQALLVGVLLFSIGLIASSFLITAARARVATLAAGAGFVLGLFVMAVSTPALGGAFAAAAGVGAGAALTAVLATVESVRLRGRSPLAEREADPPRALR